MGTTVKVEFTTGNGESESKVTVPMRLENSTSHGVTTMPNNDRQKGTS